MLQQVQPDTVEAYQAGREEEGDSRFQPLLLEQPDFELVASQLSSWGHYLHSVGLYI